MAEIEKVIDGLEQLKFFNQRAGRELWNSKSINIQNVDIDNAEKKLDEAIQTIRELESKSEEVCEWRRMGDGWYSEPTCDSDVRYICYSEDMICEWKYCPYCGRKIKVVE